MGHQSTLYVDPSTGLLNHVADPLGNTTWFGYNGYGDLYVIDDPLGNQTYRGTDAAGRVTAIFDPLRNTTSFAYDNLDHLTSITNPSPTGGVTNFTYDANENLLTVEDALGSAHTTTYTYDAMNQRITRKDALGKSESYQYDANGNLGNYTDRNGVTVNYTYDGLNRLIGANFNSGAYLANYFWDGGDRLTEAADTVAGTIKRQYGSSSTSLASGLDFMTQEATPQGTVNYTPDAAGRRTSMTVAGQNAVSYTYDNANRLTEISQTGTGGVSFGYDNADRRTLLTLPNSVTQAYVYDADSHVTSLTYKDGATTIGNLTYTYDPDGRRNSVDGTLAAVYIPSAYECTNTYNADNEMTKYCGIYAPGAVPTYDNNGQMTSDGTGFTYTWDTRRHLSAISAYPASYVYDALGRRVSKTMFGTTTQFLYDGLNPIEELNGSGGLVATMLTGLNVDEYFERSEPACCGPLNYLTDALGSTQSLVDSSGAVQVQYEYDPFGDTFFSLFNVDSTSSYQFTGREDDEIGVGDDLYYYRSRYYNAALQRFLSQDPIDFAGGDTNLYGYVRNSPTNDVDATGLCGDHPCFGWGRQLRGNLGTVGHAGGFGTAVPAESAVIDPVQWGGKDVVGPIRGGISGVVGPWNFNMVGDVIGGTFGIPVPGMNTRRGLESLNPGLLVIELPGAPLDWGVVPIVVNLPEGVPCPVGMVPAQIIQ